MSLREAYLGARIIETNDNYARADTPLLTRPEGRQSDEYYYHYDDRAFWERVFDNPEAAWGQVDFFGTVLSEWVARVPGLFYKPEARKMREVAEEKVTYMSNGWRVLHPPGKSEKVMGGIGTFRLPPAADGTRLVTLTTTMNASAGVPALVFPDVWDEIGQRGPREGRVLLHGQARWQSMAEGWSAHFKSTRDIPRGYLVLDDPDRIEVQDEQAAVQIHPFTVMEYYAGARELFDYVYAIGDTAYLSYRGRLSAFFEAYKDENDRYGRYLLAGDMIEALWDAEYDSPADLRRADPGSESQLALLEARVGERLLGEDKIEAMLEALGKTSDSDADVRRLSQDVGIPPAVWYRGGSMAEICSQFMQEIVRRNKLGELVDTFASLYPAAIA